MSPSARRWQLFEAGGTDETMTTTTTHRHVIGTPRIAARDSPITFSKPGLVSSRAERAAKCRPRELSGGDPSCPCKPCTQHGAQMRDIVNTCEIATHQH